MADDRHEDLLHVFLASPGDVGGEREFVRNYLETVLPKDPFLPQPVYFDVVSWDHPAASVPMPAHLTPQQAVIRFKRKPADCDIVIVILWGRLGTHLDPASLVRPDGSRFLSGTEWEYENAFDAKPRPDILVYRRTDPPRISLARGPLRDMALQQLDRVEDFVGRFKNPDGSWNGGFHEYAGLDAFKQKLRNDLEHIVAERLKRGLAVAEPTVLPTSAPLPATSVATIPLPDRCLGRDDDTNVVVAALVATDPHRAVLVQGPGGIGKTTLTQQAANHETVIARFGQRRWFVELDTATDRDTFDNAILLALGLDPTLGFDAALARLAQGRSLLVLDNLETPWGGDTLAIEQRLARLAAVPDLVLLASFRGDEAVGGAHWSLRHTVHPLSPDDAKALFFDIAQKIRSDDRHLPDLLAALGGVPLAINLTARRAARHDSLAELWTEWLAAGSAVAHLPGAAPGRLTSVPQSIEFSLRSSRLGQAGRRLFRLLGQLPAGIADEDRGTLLARDAFIAHEQVQGVGLAFMRAGRLDLLPPVRDHARRVHPPEAADAEWFRHYLTLTKDLGPRAGADGGAEALERLTPELPNIEAAIDAAVAGEGLAPALEAQFGLCETIRFGGMGSSRPLASLAAACAAADDTRGEAHCILGLGNIALDRSDHDAARSRYEEALPLYRRVGAVRGEARCIERLGDIALARSDHDAARSRYEEALPLYRRVGDVLGEANCLLRYGDVANAGKDRETARTHFVGALELYERVHSLDGVALAHERLATVTTGEARGEHVRTAKATWLAMKLPEQAGRVDQRIR
jgi:tetratricopeptide (TPR) repeat protein